MPEFLKIVLLALGGAIIGTVAVAIITLIAFTFQRRQP